MALFTGLGNSLASLAPGNRLLLRWQLATPGIHALRSPIGCCIHGVAFTGFCSRTSVSNHGCHNSRSSQKDANARPGAPLSANILCGTFNILVFARARRIIPIAIPSFLSLIIATSLSQDGYSHTGLAHTSHKTSHKKESPFAVKCSSRACLAVTPAYGFMRCQSL